MPAAAAIIITAVEINLTGAGAAAGGITKTVQRQRAASLNRQIAGHRECQTRFAPEPVKALLALTVRLLELNGLPAATPAWPRIDYVRQRR